MKGIIYRDLIKYSYSNHTKTAQQTRYRWWYNIITSRDKNTWLVFMRYLTWRYESYHRNLWKRKDQQAMETFVALTHPNNIKSYLREAKSKKYNLIKEYHTPELLDFFSYLDSWDQSLKDATKYETWNKELIISKSKIFGHTASIYKISTSKVGFWFYLIIDNKWVAWSQSVWNASDKIKDMEIYKDFIAVNKSEYQTTRDRNGKKDYKMNSCIEIIAFNGNRAKVGSFDRDKKEKKFSCIHADCKWSSTYDKNRNHLGWRTRR